jgi:hypothetical protein
VLTLGYVAKIPWPAMPPLFTRLKSERFPAHCVTA